MARREGEGAMRRAIFVLGMLLAPALFACGTQPIGRVAVPGTTVAIPVPPSYAPGFGLRIGTDPAAAPAYVEGHAQEDPQRGELLFKLTSAGGAISYGYLPRRWITRAALDESTPESLNGSFDGTSGQVIAFVDIPTTIATGDYEIRVERFRRDPASPTRAFAPVTTMITETIPLGGPVSMPWRGWGTADPSSGIPIKIQGPAIDPPMYTELHGWAEVFGDYADGPFSQEELRDYTPYPSFAIYAGLGPTWPAAVQMEFDYPIERMRIRGVKVFRDGPSSAIVRWQAEDPNATVGCSPGSPGRLKIHLIDPDRQALGVEVAYELRNFSASCGNRVVPSDDVDFVASTYETYDQDGVQLSGFTPVIANLDR